MVVVSGGDHWRLVCVIDEAGPCVGDGVALVACPCADCFVDGFAVGQLVEHVWYEVSVYGDSDCVE